MPCLIPLPRPPAPTPPAALNGHAISRPLALEGTRRADVSQLVEDASHSEDARICFSTRDV